MTYISEAVVEYKEIDAAGPVMALIDELGNETPITEFDIRRTLKLMSEEKHVAPGPSEIDVLMEHVYAARAIA
jgi:hypothetical protein